MPPIPLSPRMAALAKPVLGPQTRSMLRQVSPRVRSRLYKEVQVAERASEQAQVEAQLAEIEHNPWRLKLTPNRINILGLEQLLNKQPLKQQPLLGLMLEQAAVAVEEGMESLRRHWVRQILAGAVPNWPSLSPATVKSKQPGTTNKPLVNTGRLMRLMATWPIQISVVQRGNEIEIRAGLVPAPVAEDKDKTLSYSIPQDMFGGRAVITTRGGKRMPAIPARPLKAPVGFLEGIQAPSLISEMLASNRASWVY